MTISNLRKGARVETSGRGRTKNWKHYTGTVTKKRGNNIFVHWDKTSFEDQMSRHEVKLLKFSFNDRPG